jgi:hypothetical protein
MEHKRSFQKEIVSLKRELAEEILEECRQKNLNQWLLERRDCVNFLNSNPHDRIIYAKETGLFPED